MQRPKTFSHAHRLQSSHRQTASASVSIDVGGMPGVGLLNGTVWHDADFDDALRVRTEGNVASGRSQERIDQLSEEADRALRKYRSTLEQIDALRAYNRQMETLIDAQQAEMSSLRVEIDQVGLVGRAVTPLMLQMIESLDQFVELDIPFLLDERRQRVAHLRELMDRVEFRRGGREVVLFSAGS